MISRLLLAALLALLPLGAEAANCNSNPFTLTNGQTADATQVMANFNNLLNCSNNNLAHNGANSDITSLSGLTTPLSVPQGGTGATSFTASDGVLIGNGTTNLVTVDHSTAGNVLTSNGATWISTGANLTSIVDGPNGGLQFTRAGPTITALLSPANLLTKTTVLSSDSLFLMDASAANVGKTSTVPQIATALQAIPGYFGAITKGTTLTVNVATAKVNGFTAGGHGLGRQPDAVFVYLQCTTAEGGYSVGDRTNGFNTSSAVANWSVSWDTTFVRILAQAGVNYAIQAKNSGAVLSLTDANWSIVAVPVIFNSSPF